MVLSHLFWIGFFRREFVPQPHAIVDVLEKRTLPAFAGIEQEAETVSEEAWEAFMSGPGTGYEDPGDFAEAAQQAVFTLHAVAWRSSRDGEPLRRRSIPRLRAASHAFSP